MSLYEDMKCALAPIIGMRNRLTSFEQQLFDDALAEVQALCDDEDEQAKIAAEMMLELEQEIDNAGEAACAPASPGAFSAQPPQKHGEAEPS
jgi:hypothetical protein